MKMSDIFNLPLNEEQVYKRLGHAWGIDKSKVEAITSAINSHDRLEQENAELRASVEKKDKLNDSLAKEVLIRSEENEELMGVINVLSNADNHSVSQVRMAVRKARQLLNK